MNPRLVKMIGMVFMLVFLVYVLRFSIAEHYFKKADYNFNRALKFNQKEQSDAFFLALHQLKITLKFRKLHTKALDLKGEILYRQWWLKPDGDFLNDSELLQQSKALHELALDGRQQWPFTMLQLTRVEAHKPHLDKDFYFRFNQTYQYGRFETAIGLELMKLGVLRWQQLNPETKVKVIELTNISVQQKRNNLKNISLILDSAGLFGFMCTRIEKNIRQKTLCSEILTGS